MVSEKVKKHLDKIAKVEQRKTSDISSELIVKGFVEKLECFDRIVQENNLQNISTFKKNDICGALVITYSGSLLSIGPLINGVRIVEYASIGLRTDVPDIATENNSELENDIIIDSTANFIKGPIKSSSWVYKIAKVNNKLEMLEQNELLSDVTKILIDDFIEVNKVDK